MISNCRLPLSLSPKNPIWAIPSTHLLMPVRPCASSGIRPTSIFAWHFGHTVFRPAMECSSRWRLTNIIHGGGKVRIMVPPVSAQRNYLGHAGIGGDLPFTLEDGEAQDEKDCCRCGDRS